MSCALARRFLWHVRPAESYAPSLMKTMLSATAFVLMLIACWLLTTHAAAVYMAERAGVKLQAPSLAQLHRQVSGR